MRREGLGFEPGRERESGGRIIYWQRTVISGAQCNPESEISAQARLDAKSGKVAQGRNFFGFRLELNKA